MKNDIMPNGNGYLSLNVASSYNFIHVSSQFRMRDSKRWTRCHSRSRSRAVIDHVFLSAEQVRFFICCYTPSDFSLSSDHRPVICELNFRPKTQPHLTMTLLHLGGNVKTHFSKKLLHYMAMLTHTYSLLMIGL